MVNCQIKLIYWIRVVATFRFIFYWCITLGWRCHLYADRSMPLVQYNMKLLDPCHTAAIGLIYCTSIR